MESNHPKPVEIFRAKDSVQASMLIAELDGEGIQAWAVGGDAAVAFGAVGGDALLVDVLVNEEDLARARVVLGDFVTINRDGGALSNAPARTCSECSAEIDAGFSACWQCGATLPVSDPRLAESDSKSAQIKSPLEPPARSVKLGGSVHFVRLYLAVFFGILLCWGVPGAITSFTQEEPHPLAVLVLVGIYTPFALRWVLGLSDKRKLPTVEAGEES